MNDGSLVDANDSHLSLLNSKSRIATIAECLHKLSPSERVEWAIEAKVEANKLYNQGLFKEALERYLECITASSFNDSEKISIQTSNDNVDLLVVPVLSNMSACCIQLQEFHKGVEICNQLMGFRPENTKALLRRGICNLQLGEYSEALKDFRRIQEISSDPSFTPYQPLPPPISESPTSTDSNLLSDTDSLSSSSLPSIPCSALGVTESDLHRLPLLVLRARQGLARDKRERERLKKNMQSALSSASYSSSLGSSNHGGEREGEGDETRVRPSQRADQGPSAELKFNFSEKEIKEIQSSISSPSSLPLSNPLEVKERETERDKDESLSIIIDPYDDSLAPTSPSHFSPPISPSSSLGLRHRGKLSGGSPSLSPPDPSTSSSSPGSSTPYHLRESSFGLCMDQMWAHFSASQPSPNSKPTSSPATSPSSSSSSSWLKEQDKQTPSSSSPSSPSPSHDSLNNSQPSPNQHRRKDKETNHQPSQNPSPSQSPSPSQPSRSNLTQRQKTKIQEKQQEQEQERQINNPIAKDNERKDQPREMRLQQTKETEKHKEKEKEKEKEKAKNRARPWIHTHELLILGCVLYVLVFVLREIYIELYGDSMGET